MFDEIAAAIREMLTRAKPNVMPAMKDTDDLVEHGVLDSLLVVSLVTFLEERFDCRLDYEDLTEENLGSVAAMARLVEKRVGDRT